MSSTPKPSSPSSSRWPLFFAACAGMFVFGIVLALLGTLFGLPEMLVRLRVNLAQQGDLFLLLYFGVVVASVVVGPLIDWIGNKLVLVVSAVLVTAALGGFASAQSFATAAISAVILGVGGGGLNTAANVLVSELYGDERGAMLNLLGIFFGIGALAIPMLAASISAMFTVRQLLLQAAALTALTAATYALLGFPRKREAQGFSPGELVQVARYPGVLPLALVLFFEGGNEAAISGWTSVYVGSAGADARTATWVLAGYWAALIVGRLLAARLLRSMNKLQLVFASGVGAVVGCAVLLAARAIAGMAAGVTLAGLSFAAIYPTTLAIAGDRYPRFVGTVFSLMFSVGITGGMIYPWVIGHVAQSFGMRLPMLLPIGSSAMICVLVAVIHARDRRSSGRAH